MGLRKMSKLISQIMLNILAKQITALVMFALGLFIFFRTIVKATLTFFSLFFPRGKFFLQIGEYYTHVLDIYGIYCFVWFKIL